MTLGKQPEQTLPQCSEFERWWANWWQPSRTGLIDGSYKEVAQAAWNAAKTRAGI